MKKVMVAVIMTGGLLLWGAGCSKGDAGKTGEAASGDKIGIAECDDYVTKYTACIKKMPAVAQAPAEQGLKSAMQGWKASAAANKDATKAACKAAADAMANNPACK